MPPQTGLTAHLKGKWTVRGARGGWDLWVPVLTWKNHASLQCHVLLLIHFKCIVHTSPIEHIPSILLMRSVLYAWVLHLYLFHVWHGRINYPAYVLPYPPRSRVIVYNFFSSAEKEICAYRKQAAINTLLLFYEPRGYGGKSHFP